jgi:hypothetical protein
LPIKIIIKCIKCGNDFEHYLPHREKAKRKICDICLRERQLKCSQEKRDMKKAKKKLYELSLDPYKFSTKAFNKGETTIEHPYLKRI